jgi:hypothetical protein
MTKQIKMPAKSEATKTAKAAKPAKRRGRKPRSEMTPEELIEASRQALERERQKLRDAYKDQAVAKLIQLAAANELGLEVDLEILAEAFQSAQKGLPEEFQDALEDLRDELEKEEEETIHVDDEEDSDFDEFALQNGDGDDEHRDDDEQPQPKLPAEDETPLQRAKAASLQMQRNGE